MHNNNNKQKKAIVNSKKSLIKELKACGIKFTEKDIIFIKKDENNKTIWLEKGNDSAGLKHIISKHGKQFKDAVNIQKDKIPITIYNIITKENYVTTNIKYINGIKRINKYYKYNNTYYIFTAFGDNGFLVTSYPYKVKKGDN